MYYVLLGARVKFVVQYDASIREQIKTCSGILAQLVFNYIFLAQQKFYIEWIRSGMNENVNDIWHLTLTKHRLFKRGYTVDHAGNKLLP